MSPLLLEGKTGLVMGVANKRSIAWGIAHAANNAGARIVLTYQNERLGQNAKKLAPELNDPLLKQCDVASDDEIDQLMESIRNDVGGLDFVVHALAYAPREALSGAFAETSREAFHTALDISAYSLVAVANRAAPLMKDRNGSIVTLTYLGSERVVPNYNVMGVAKAALEASVRYLADDLGPKGIRVNAISAGPIKTLASSAISGISNMVKMNAERTPLRTPTDIGQVGDTALFLLSPLARGITGEIIYVDGGYHILGT
jgi:enoyl-[acyl-carrier protein] reductase I